MEKQFFAGAMKQRARLTAEQSRAISAMYSDLAKEVAEEQKSISGRTNVSSVLRAEYLDGLSKQINEEIVHIGKSTETGIKSAMTNVAKAVVSDNIGFLDDVGIKVKGAYSYIPVDVVEDIATGRLYDGKWTLSKAIWNQSKKAQKDINYVVAQGIAGQKSTLEIAKDLEKYVDPKAAKAWDWARVYPGTAMKVDYNAQRLARTMVSHAYEESFVRTTKDNPFFECYRWLISNHENVCEICQDRATDFHGVVVNGQPMYGCYNKNELPLDHPNGRCTFSVEMSESMEEVGEDLADWVLGGSNSGLDNFAKSMGYTPEAVKNSIT